MPLGARAGLIRSGVTISGHARPEHARVLSVADRPGWVHSLSVPPWGRGGAGRTTGGRAARVFAGSLATRSGDVSDRTGGIRSARRLRARSHLRPYGRAVARPGLGWFGRRPRREDQRPRRAGVVGCDPCMEARGAARRRGRRCPHGDRGGVWRRGARGSGGPAWRSRARLRARLRRPLVGGLAPRGIPGEPLAGRRLPAATSGRQGVAGLAEARRGDRVIRYHAAAR